LIHTQEVPSSGLDRDIDYPDIAFSCFPPVPPKHSGIVYLICSIVLYGCETWTLTIREEHRLNIFENRALRRIFGTKRKEMTGG
jgi:hypothetical protein